MQSLEYQNKSVFFVGDIALSGDIGIESLDLFCSPLNALKEKGDLLIANLEIPISTPAYTPIHVCNTEILEAGLRLLGVTHVNLANNHILDGGLEGLRRTLVVLERLNIQFTGVSLSENYCDPILFNCKGRDIALLGYVHPSTHVKNHPTSGVYINIWNPELAQTEIQKWTAQGYEVWVSIHWGDDYSYCVNRDQVDIATNITAWGA
ncbi:MAG: hypothetical protein FJX95_02965, partial [Bacteroidetes bacterium]|nr:hypothetical protein [Bacteroidota bacterium]